MLVSIKFDMHALLEQLESIRHMAAQHPAKCAAAVALLDSRAVPGCDLFEIDQNITENDVRMTIVIRDWIMHKIRTAQ